MKKVHLSHDQSWIWSAIAKIYPLIPDGKLKKINSDNQTQFYRLLNSNRITKRIGLFRNSIHSAKNLYFYTLFYNWKKQISNWENRDQKRSKRNESE